MIIVISKKAKPREERVFLAMCNGVYTVFGCVFIGGSGSGESGDDMDDTIDVDADSGSGSGNDSTY